MALTDAKAAAELGFNPTRLSAGNEIQAADVGVLVRGQVSIQPGYPPGMRSNSSNLPTTGRLFQSNPAIRRE